jgi:hypothetical protein
VSDGAVGAVTRPAVGSECEADAVIDTSLAWTVIQPSCLAARWRMAGAALTLATALGLVAGAGAADSPWLALCAALVAAGAGVAALRRRGDGGPPLQIRVAPDGSVRLRSVELTGVPGAGGEVRAAQAAAHWITLAADGRTTVVWRDSVPAPLFRQLAARARWAEPARDTALPGRSG